MINLINNIILFIINKMNANSCLNIIMNETIKYNNSILIQSNTLIETYHYSRTFNIDMNFKLINIKLNIPLVGIDKEKQYARILLYFDDEMICDGSIWSHIPWELKPLFLEGIATNVKEGNHKIKLMCCVTGGSLNIPYFDTKSVLFKIKPELSSKLIVIGQN